MPTKKTGKTTIYDVAEMAGVAISTVSRVLNSSPDVSEPTRSRVLKAIDALQFRPDRTAKSLAQKQLRSVCVALPSFTTPFHNEFLKGIRGELANRDYDLLLCDLGSTAPRSTLIRFLKRGAVDGLILAGMPVNADLSAELKALHAPVVLVGHSRDEFDSFTWDDFTGGRLAAEHLIEQGHVDVAKITTASPSNLQTDRLRGYRQAIADAGLDYDPDLVFTGETPKHAGFSEEAGYEAAGKLLASGRSFTAIFCAADVHALGALLALTEAGLRVPDDVAIVGYDDIKSSRYISLTSVNQHMRKTGGHAMQRLLELMEPGGDKTPRSVVITPTLEVRLSSLRPTAA
jgi:LacI family transcriptional regulator